MSLSRSAVKLARNVITLFLCQLCHALCLWQVLANKAVYVFIAASLPGMVWISKIEPGYALLFYRHVLMEFGAVIRRDGFKSKWISTYQLDGVLVQGNSRFIRQFSNHDEACLSL